MAVALPRWPGRRHSTPHAAVARGDLQSAQRALVVRGQPRERGAAFGRAQRLLERPQRVFRRLAVHDEKTREIETGRRERRRIRPVRRRDPHDVALLRLHVRERGQRQTDFADAFAFEQQLRQRALRPAAPRQRSVERREARRHGRRFRRAIVAAPDRGVGEQRREGGRRCGHWACGTGFRGPAPVARGRTVRPGCRGTGNSSRFSIPTVLPPGRRARAPSRWPPECRRRGSRAAESSAGRS